MSFPGHGDALVPAGSLTRNRRHHALVNQACTTRIQTTVRLSSLGKIQLFVALATLNSTIGHAVQDLIISLPLHAGYPAQLVRDCLQLTPNVDNLLLVLPSFSPVTVLQGVSLPRLRTLSTNLPHRILLVFLTLHPSITALALDACGGRNRCPLRNLNLAHFSDLKCPAQCLEGLARGQVAVATVHLTRLASTATLAIRALSTSPLYSLAIDFFSDDYDILARVVAAAPLLRKLKLIEKPRVQRRYHHARRPWNDLQEWHRMLLQLPFLEEFMLHTPIRLSGPRRPEQVIVNSWANGTTRRAARHSNLYHISILQQGPIGDAQSLSHWFRRRGLWERVSAVVVDRDHSFVL
ncbi:hypothetical protein OH76DRAFT_1491102 [Lentinus brumalis]|uniref:F-box domain-containing protein n=1 Tax=Lentinus brumalis TaxID=2498619 RepID=A0A371CGT1_9APHY|nr:hypothetical protein OH76DRAFT_1491102 [Polyporus brumalis]